MKKIHIETWGCQMNVADSERMLGLMKQQDYTLVQDPDGADLIILNTCHIREKAKHKVMSRLGVLKDLKKTNPGLTIAVTGCVAQAEGKKLLGDTPAIDVLLGPGKIAELPRLVEQHKETGKQTMAIGFKIEKEDENPAPTACHEEVLEMPTITGRNEVSRFVNIQQGCNNYCTFCVVPFTRGREISERPEAVVARAKALLDQGAMEITLLGQNVNSYGLDIGANFVDLLEQVAQLDGLKSLRFTTSNPHDFTKPLADLFGKYPVMGRYIHLPVQSGSDAILSAMKRKVTVAEYLERIAWLRDAVPDMAISTDLIVGFPGETEEDFEETLDLIRKVRFSFVFAFNYSKRKHTVATRMEGQIPEDVKSARLARLNALQDQITLEQNLAEVGQTRSALILYQSKKTPGFYYGRTPHFKLVRVPSGRDLVGQTVQVRILEANKTALTGELV